MTFYGYIVASNYKFNVLAGQSRSTRLMFPSAGYWPVSNAAGYAGICQALQAYVLLLIVKKITGIDTVHWLFYHPFIYCSLGFAWMGAAKLYYREDRVLALVDELDSKPEAERSKWRVATVAVLVVPAVLIYLLT